MTTSTTPTVTLPVATVQQASILVDELDADLNYIFGRIKNDETCELQIAVDVRAKLRKIRAALSLPTPSTTGEADTGRAEFCYLVEHFLGDGTGNSTGSYHTGFTDLSGNSKTTKNPHEAKRYDTAKEANKAAMKLGRTLSGTWRAVEHGFHTLPQQVEQSPQPQGGQRLQGFEAIHTENGGVVLRETEVRIPAPQPQGDLLAAVDWIDDFIARCNGDDRGACESVNIVRAAILSAPVTERAPLTEAEYTAMAHRIASKYAHRSDPQHIAYTFLPHTLEQFVRAIEGGIGAAAQPAAAKASPAPRMLSED